MTIKNFNGKFIAAIFLIGLFFCANIKAQQCKGLAVTKVRLITALHKGYKTSQILEIINRCGVNFQSDSETNQELAAAGAGKNILAAIQNSYHTQTVAKDADPDFKKGYDFYQAGQMEAAIKAFQASIALKPSFAAYYDLGLSYDQLDQLKESMTAFEKAVQLDANSAEGWAALGEVYYNSSESGGGDKADEAIQAFQKSLALNANQKTVLMMLAEMYRSGGQYKEAIDALQKALKIDSTYGEAWTNVCFVEKEMNSFGESAQDFTKAFQAGKQAVKFLPEDADSWQCYGEAASETKNYADAVSALEKAVQLNPDDEDLKDELKDAKKALKKNK